MGSSKKVTVGYKYYLGMHLILCHGPADSLRRITVDDRQAWAGNHTGGPLTVSAEGLFGGEQREGGVSGQVDIEMGLPSQGRNSYLQAQLGTDIPAFRGVVGAVLRQCYLGLNPYLKRWAFRLQRIHLRQNGLAQWYDIKSAIPSGASDATDALSVAWTLIGKAPQTGNVYTYDGAASSPASQTRTYSSGTGEVDNVTLRVQGLVEFRTFTGSTPVSGTVVKGGTPGPSSGYNVYKLQISSPAATYYFNNGTSTETVHGIDETFDIQIADGASVTLSYSVEDGKMVSDYQELSLVVVASTAQYDMNPAHIIRECLTDPDWGMGYQDADVDDAAFTYAADILYQEGMGMSLLWDRQMPIEDFVMEVVKHINASVYVDRSTGKFVLKLIRDDYEKEDLLVIDQDHISKVENATRPTTGELVNSISVVYWNAITGENASLTVQDQALIQMQGSVVNTTLQFPGFTSSSIAAKVALRSLRSLSTPLLSCTVYADRTASRLNVGDVFRLTWPDLEIDDLVMRVAALAFGDGKANTVKITCIEDAFSFPETATVVPDDPEWENPSQPATPSPYRLVTEAPYYELVQTVSQLEIDDMLASSPEAGLLMASAVSPPGGIQAVLSTNAGAGFEDVAALDFCPFASLAADVGPTDTVLSVTDGVDLDLVEVGTLAQLGEEQVRVDAVDLALQTVTVGRGCLDTPPLAHDAGATLFFWDVYNAMDRTEYTVGETVQAKVIPTTGGGALNPADAPVDSVTMSQRAYRPYSPGDLRFDANSYPPVVFAATTSVSWKHRDRLQQTAGSVLDHTAGNIGPEDGVSYRLRLYDEGMNLMSEVPGIAGTSQIVDLSGLSSEVATVMVYSERGGLLSWRPALHTFTFTLATIFVVLPLTYDEDDYDASMTWVRQGSGPHVTPSGFEGNGWNSRLKSTTIPAWMSSQFGRLTVHASVRPQMAQVMNSSGDTVVHVGADASGAVPQAKLALRMLQDPNRSTWPYLALQSYTGSLQTMPLVRPQWKFQGQFPQLVAGAYAARPQAILFIDATTLLVSAHYEDTETRVFRVDLATGNVTGSFSFGTTTHKHIASFAVSQTGDLWAVDYDTGHTLKIDLAASLSSGTASIVADWNTAILNKVSGIDFITVGGVDYVLIAEYATSGTPYLYVIPTSQMVGGSTFAVANRFKRFNIGLRIQGIAVKSGALYVARNRQVASTDTAGYLERYDAIATTISGSADGSVLSPAFSQPAPSQYAEDIKFHPTTGECWMMTEGWASVGDFDGFLSIWSSPADGSTVENHVTATYSGTGSVQVKLNNKLFGSAAWTPTVPVATVSVGGPPQAAAGFETGYFSGYVRNVRFQNKAMTDAEYADTVAGTTYEPNSLTVLNLTLTNPGAETGTTAGWTNEVGGLAVRQLNPTPYEGSYYFNGGSFAQTIARQRVDLVAAGLTTGQLDGGNIWAKARWAQASYTNQDPATLGLRLLNGSSTQISLTYGNLGYIPYGDSGVTPNWHVLALPVDIAANTRYLDAVYRADRNSGTNNDGYLDSISLTIYRR